MKEQNVAVEVEDPVAGFLGVHVERNKENKSIKLTMKGLIRRIIEALGVKNRPVKGTPAARQALPKDPDSEPPNGAYLYPSVVGMIRACETRDSVCC